MTANEKNSFFFFILILQCQPIICLIKIQGISSMKKKILFSTLNTIGVHAIIFLTI